MLFNIKFFHGPMTYSISVLFKVVNFFRCFRFTKILNMPRNWPVMHFLMMLLRTFSLCMGNAPLIELR